MTRRGLAWASILALVTVVGCAKRVQDDAGIRPADDAPPAAATASAGGLSAPTPPRAPSRTRIVDLAVGGGRTCAVLEDGTVRCWGDNAWGRMGTGVASAPPSPVPVALPGIERARRVVLAFSHGCVLDDAGGLACWGWGGDGGLGFRPTDACPIGAAREPCATSPRPVPGLGGAVVDVGVGGGHTCAVLAGGEVRCWGDGRDGRLGFVPGEIGAHGPSAFAPGRVPGLARVRQISLGSEHTCALHEDGGVSCWGSNFDGQLGRGTNDEAQHVAPARVPGLVGVVELAAGSEHTCARLAGGDVRCWGANTYGEIGAPSGHDCWGLACARSPLAVRSLHGVRALTAGGGATCALLDDGVPRCWGSDAEEALHLGAPDCRPDKIYWNPCTETPMPVAGVPPLARLATAEYHTCALARSGELWCWGVAKDRALGFEPLACAAHPDWSGCVEPPRQVPW